ncbi:MAG: MptD family putative ECF transporter S component [Chloroflexi bacterium]|nr:MptD family putative ECF transporter S component [Chloroflexota bacterium]
MKFTTRQLVTLAIFGALWGVVEISLGSALKALNIPLSGAVLSAIGVMIALIARQLVPLPGATLFVGVVATILKLFSIGSVIIGPMIAIMMEALLAEIILSLIKKPNLPACLLAGASGSLWSLVQPFFTGILLFGRDLFTIWLSLLDTGERIFGLDPNAAWIIVLVLVLAHSLIGMTGGWLARSVGKLLLARMPALQPQQPPS